MFWLGVRVLFWRQMFGFKRRWIMSTSSILFPIVWTLLLHLSNPRSGGGFERGNKVQIHSYSGRLLEDSGFSKFPEPLTVIVMPKNLEMRSLMAKAQSALQPQYSSSSSLDLHLRFAVSPEDFNRSLAGSAWPSIGVEFHNMTDHQLNYTLHPVIASNTPENFTGNFGDDISPYSLLLQAAIDAAYVQTHFPDRAYFRLGSFPKLEDFDEEMRDDDADLSFKKYILAVVLIILYHNQVSTGMLILIIFLASFTVGDKSSGVRELLCINGLPRWMVNTSWLFTFSLVATISAIVQTMILKTPPSNPLSPGISTGALAVFLIVYHLTATFSVYLVANIFTSQLVSISLIVLYYQVISPLGWTVLLLEEYFVAQAFISLLPNVGSIMFCVASLKSYYEFKRDITFENIFSKSDKFISPGLVLIMMLISLIILLGLGMYFDAVRPGPYGRARPWYLFTRKEKSTTDDGWFEVESPSDAVVYQPIKEGLPIGLECVKIVKKFGTHKALNKVNLRIIKNKITVLLGHNGAGKTTLFSILCGMFSPTSGDVFTDEYNVFEGNNIKKFRSVLGYCPQENLLMQELTVHEHLIVFGLLKGLVMSEAVDYSDKWTQKFEMQSMRNTQAKNLSGGSKRKVCLAIAMTGNPQYLLLDEPSAGLDIESTKKFCGLLLEEKGNCTVVVTTHNMDEAEMLGDHIAILAHGELKCFGSASFLKKMLDTGYRLNCSIMSSTSMQDAIKAVSELIPGAKILYKTNHSVTFSLPRERTNDIPDLLQKLESRFGEKMSSTLSPSTLDDVFLKVQKDMGVKIAVEELPSISEDTMRRSCWNFIELFMKRAKWLLSPRMVSMIIFVILLPTLLMVACMAIINSTMKGDSSQRSLLIESLSKAGQGILALVSGQHDHISDFGQSALVGKSVTFRETSKNMNSTMGNMTKKYLFKYHSRVLFSLDSQSSDTQIASSPNKSGHDASKIYTALINALIQGNTSIITYNAPFLKQQTFNEVSYKCPTADVNGLIIPKVISFVLSLSFLLASAYFVTFPHLERTTMFKHLQLMTGLLPAAYWIANLVFDMLIYIGSCVLIIIITASMDHTKVFMESNVMCAFILLLFLYGLSSIPYSYIWSFFCGSESLAIFSLIIFNVAFPIAVGYIWPSMNKFVPIILPYKVLNESMRKLIEWAIKKRDCRYCPTSNHEESCFHVYHNPLLEDMIADFVILTVQAITWFVILMLFDHGVVSKVKCGIARVCCGDIRSLDHDVDPEVALERELVKDIVMKGNEQPELIVNGLGKNYYRKTAVFDVTFALERGECFGLVGVNGSGKTTTFGMLAALLNPTKGTAIIEGTWKLTGCEYKYMKRVGYCPQYNGLLKELTGNTILELFGRLCGVPRSEINALVDKWINALGMAEIAKRPCGQYSGGNKRKLSLAIALIGNPPIALLDEPTAGVDPVIRRRIWEILAKRLEQNQTIILTSHTMSECEAICGRLTIMVKGVMKCLGPIPTLKKTFGKRSILDVKFKSNSTSQEQEDVKSMIESEFEGYITLEERHLTRLKFSLNTENTKMYNLFATMMRIQSDYDVVEDFNLVEAPLEQVFMMFATKSTNRN